MTRGHASRRSTADERKDRIVKRRQDDSGPRATFRQLLPHLFGQRGPLVLAIVLSVLGAAASLAQPILVGLVIARVQGGETLGPLVWVLVAMVVLAAGLSAVQHYLLQRMGEGVVLSTRRQLLARLLRLPIAEFDARRTGDLVSRVGADATLLRAVLTQGLVEAIGGVLTFVGSLIAMAIIDWVLLLLTLGVVAIAIAAVAAVSPFIRRASAEAQARVGSLTAAVERAISGIRTIRAANATERELETIDRETVGAYRAGLKVARASAAIVPIAGIAMQASFIVVLGVGGFRVASGAIEIAALVSFILFLFMLILPLGQFFGAVSAVNQALGALGRIQEIIALPPEAEFTVEGRGDRVEPPTVTSPITRASAIQFDDVEFVYPGSTLPVLRGVTFAVPRGRRTALVGPSGAGKSTVLALIERFYDPTGGVVRFDGVDVRDIDRRDLRARIGYVEQDAPVLAGTIRDNLLLGRADATDAECADVLRRVNLGEVLDRDPAGLDAQVGEDGIMLSGGERQRLAIARALLAAPPLLLLDEATASLDGANERLLREALDAVAADRTLLVIAHRLATVVDSDQIIVLDHGRVVGTGTHEELVASTPLYRDLARHQLLA